MKRLLGAFGMLWAVTSLAATIVVAAPGLDGTVRRGLVERLVPEPGSMALAAEIMSNNARWVFALLLLSAARSRLAVPRRLDLLVYLNAGVNAALVGCALGAFGLAAVPYLRHLPVEWMAMAAALRGYRTGARPMFAAAVVLVVVGAFCEAYLTPQ